MKLGSVSQSVSNACIVEGLTLTNGVGSFNGSVLAGGGVFIDSTNVLNAAIEPVFKNCEFTANTADRGPAIFFPLTMVIQGVIVEGPGLFAATNAVVLAIQ